jgi:hypothetical protein
MGSYPGTLTRDVHTITSLFSDASGRPVSDTGNRRVFIRTQGHVHLNHPVEREGRGDIRPVPGPIVEGQRQWLENPRHDSGTMQAW